MDREHGQNQVEKGDDLGDRAVALAEQLGRIIGTCGIRGSCGSFYRCGGSSRSKRRRRYTFLIFDYCFESGRLERISRRPDLFTPMSRSSGTLHTGT